ncbi:MAG: hypothetical protein EP330_02250 [Deltaproteobacteria bacterium]|nr:MAG: hypothetical protein EP330_02250 [Deltaproteobacteria bacterium]
MSWSGVWVTLACACGPDVLGLLLALAVPAHAGWQAESSPSDTLQRIALDAEQEVVGTKGVVSLPQLVVECDRKRLAVYVRTPGLRPEVQTDYYDDFLALTRQQLDSEPAANQFMRKDVQVETLHYRNARKQLKLLRTHDVLLFAFQPFGAEPVETRFELDGLETSLTTLHPRCQR